MKLPLIFLSCLLFASCNSGRYYANYRAGGKQSAETTESLFCKDTTLLLVDKKNEIVSPPADEILYDTVCFTPVEKPLVAPVKSKIDLPEKIRSKSALLKQKIPVTISLKEKNNGYSPVKKGTKSLENFNWSAVWDALVGIFLIGSLVFAITTYLISVNFALGEILMIALVIAITILLCIGLGKLITGIFPGMSRSKKK